MTNFKSGLETVLQILVQQYQFFHVVIMSYLT